MENADQSFRNWMHFWQTYRSFFGLSINGFNYTSPPFNFSSFLVSADKTVLNAYWVKSSFQSKIAPEVLRWPDTGDTIIGSPSTTNYFRIPLSFHSSQWLMVGTEVLSEVRLIACVSRARRIIPSNVLFRFPDPHWTAWNCCCVLIPFGEVLNLGRPLSLSWKFGFWMQIDISRWSTCEPSCSGWALYWQVLQ